MGAEISPSDSSTLDSRGRYSFWMALCSAMLEVEIRILCYVGLPGVPHFVPFRCSAAEKRKKEPYSTAELLPVRLRTRWIPLLMRAVGALDEVDTLYFICF